MIEDLKICSKRRYESEREAEIMIEFLESDGRAEPGELRYYKCHVCHNWHLTSKKK